MNNHLKPALDILFKLEKSGIDYWVYGGVSVAGFVGRFIRKNKDIDVFVTDDSFNRTVAFLEKECHLFGLVPQNHPPKNPGDRPKFELFPASGRHDLLSVIPVYNEYGKVVFKYPRHPEIYSIQILERVERRILSYRLFTPPDRFIKEIFINHITARPDKKARNEFIIDAKNILSPEELANLNWNI